MEKPLVDAIAEVLPEAFASPYLDEWPKDEADFWRDDRGPADQRQAKINRIRQLKAARVVIEQILPAYGISVDPKAVPLGGKESSDGN